jgi:hypothetical protein
MQIFHLIYSNKKTFLLIFFQQKKQKKLIKLVFGSDLVNLNKRARDFL